MDALVPHAPIHAGPASGQGRTLAAIADLAVAVVLSLTTTAAVLAAVIAFAMIGGGGRLPASPVEAALYLAFPAFEFLVFTPVWVVAPVTCTGAGLSFWMSRRGILPMRSPGMLITGAPRRTAER